MSLTNLCSCALTKDHKMRQVINNRYLLESILKNYEFGIIVLRKNILINFCKNLYPFSPPPPLYSVPRLMKKSSVRRGGGGGVFWEFN